MNSWDQATFTNILRALQKVDDGTFDAIRVECYSAEEAKLLREQLPPAHRDKVLFTWLEFGRRTPAVEQDTDLRLRGRHNHCSVANAIELLELEHSLRVAEAIARPACAWETDSSGKVIRALSREDLLASGLKAADEDTGEDGLQTRHRRPIVGGLGRIPVVEPDLVVPFVVPDGSPLAPKLNTCDYCDKPVKPGETHRVGAGFYDGDWSDICQACYDALELE